MSIQLDYANLLPDLTYEEIRALEPVMRNSLEVLKNRTGAGSDFLGWVDLPEEISETEISEIEKIAGDFRRKCDVFIAIGIGGSYLGAKAVIESLLGSAGPYETSRDPIILYAGQHMSSRQTQRILDFIEGKDVCLNVISKSGTTTEPGVAFRLLKDWMESKYGDEAAKRIVATTDRSKGALKKLAVQNGYRTFVIPDNVGGRFSVLTPVGLFPLAVAGIDIREFVEGFRAGRRKYLLVDSITKNPAMFYAGARHLLFKKGKTTEIMANFEPDLHSIGEWWKQLYGESEGKNHLGLFPASVDFSTDLHSLGQYIQDGVRNIFETFLMVRDSGVEIKVPANKENLDGLNYLTNNSLAEINEHAYRGTSLAHKDGGVPNMTIWIDGINEKSIGELFYFFEIGISLSGYLLKINPFDQPGVEAYKKNMFALLGKPGVETATEEILAKLKENPTRIIPKKN